MLTEQPQETMSAQLLPESTMQGEQHIVYMYGLNGVGPEVAIDEYATYVLSSLLYGLEAWVLER